MSIGELLRTEREKKGISLSEAESALKIRAVYIEALEAERFEDIPAEVYRIGYLKNYARLLGLDSSALVARYKAAATGPEPKPERIIVAESTSLSDLASTSISDHETSPVAGPGVRPGTDGSLPGETARALLPKKARLLRWLAVAAVVLLLAAAGIGLGLNASNQPLPPPAPEQQANPPESNPPPAVVQQSTLEIRLVGIGHCWANVRVDGVEAYTGTINPGDTKTFTARESVWMHLGYPKGVEVYYNGEKLPPLGEERPVKREFTKDLGA